MGYKTTDTCLAKAGVDEPIFVLRAKDELAPAIVDMWAHWLRSKAYEHMGTELAAKMHLKAAEAQATAAEMRAWQLRHGCHLPD